MNDAAAPGSALSAARRSGEVARVLGGDGLDVLVIGGGITGAGAALDAASRGLSTALIEREDLAFGTSRWSSKLAHGGLRYLATGDFGVAYESAVERGRLLRNAPHLAQGMPLMLPLLRSVGSKKAFAMGAGFLAGDVLRRLAHTPSSVLPPPRRLSARRTLELAPVLPQSQLRGSLVMTDGQLSDDARLVIAVARTAAAAGATILTGVGAERITSAGVEVTDRRTGERATIRARAVINATGVWAASLGPELSLSPSRGTHVVLSGDALPGLRTSLTLPYPGQHNRYLLVLPQPDGRIYLGLTDEAVDTIDDVPQPQRWEIDEMVGVLGAALGRSVGPAHVLGAFAGLRPLVAVPGDSGPTAALSRDHVILRGEHRAVHVVGGKLTTYRLMAEQSVDAALEHAGLGAPASRTATLPLVGALAPSVLRALGETALRIGRYGGEAPLISAAERSYPESAEPIAPGVPVSHAELDFAIAREGAMSVGDLLDRRFRVGLDPVQRAAAIPAAEAALARAS